jgi:hypothetical protein
MIRANLLPHPNERLTVFGTDINAGYLRQALLGAAIAAAIAILGNGIEMLRLHRYEAAANDTNAALMSRAAMRAESKRLALDVARYQEIAREADDVRRSGPSAAVAIARIGNAIPTGVWLDSLTHTATGYELGGESRSVDALGGAILTLNHALPQRTATLVSIDNREATPDAIRFAARIAGDPTPVPTP